MVVTDIILKGQFGNKSFGMAKLTKNSWAAVIRVVYEDPVFSCAVNDLSASALQRFLVPEKHRIQILSRNIFAGVILKRMTIFRLELQRSTQLRQNYMCIQATSHMLLQYHKQ